MKEVVREAVRKEQIVPGKIRVISIFLALIVATVVTTAVVLGDVQRKDRAVQEHLAEEVLRFHVLRNGGCIDGSEIFANIVVHQIYNKTGKDYSISYILIGFNLIVYLAVFVHISRDSAMLSLLVYIIATAIIDHFTDHFEAIKQITIITKDPDRIIRQIKEDLNKTCTIINSSGVIAGENKTLICYVNYFELQKVKTIISENKGTFSTVSTIEEILR